MSDVPEQELLVHADAAKFIYRVVFEAQIFNLERVALESNVLIKHTLLAFLWLWIV